MENHTLDEFCGSKFWDTNLTWNTNSPELTECFQRTILVWVPCLFLWTFSFLEIYYILSSRRKSAGCTWIFQSKLIFTIVLIVLAISDLIKAVHTSTYTTIYSVDYYTPCVQILSFTLTLFFLLFNQKHGIQTSGLLFLFWFSLVLCGVVQFRSIFINNVDKASYKVVSYFIYYALIIVIFLLNFLVDAEPKFSDHPPVERPCPELSASFPSRITFSWFNSVAWKGFKKPLETTDLWSINPEDSSEKTVSRFDKYWIKSSKNSDSTRSTKVTFKKSTERMNLNNVRKKRTASVLVPLCKAFGPTFLFGVLLELIVVILTFISPQILKLLIEFTSSNEPIWRGYLYSILLLLITIIQAPLNALHLNRTFLAGLRTRTALTAAVYRKALRMSYAARKESTVGEIVNLMSVDAQKLMDVITYIDAIFLAPLEIVISLFFLWGILGPSILAGLAVMIILIPVNSWVAGKLRNLHMKQMKNKDEKVKLMNEVLSGIRVLKLYAWEPSFEQQILKVRGKEIKVLKKAAYFVAGSTFLWCCASFLVSLASFSTYVLIDANNILDSTTAFVSISLFNILSFSFSELPLVISDVIQASVSLKRINKFMNSEELDMNNVQHDSSEANPIVIENATFAWDEEDMEKQTLRNINFEVKSGQIVAVVGSVGSGKSSLISALLGEMERVSGRVNTTGSIAYVSQQAWIQNATLQDNVLFGKAFDEKLYNRVIEACALSTDLKMLPAGDQTEIGEKGINLSGGQKQRVSLARAVYSDSDIYLLDDPLSAVDSHVGKHIFEKLIGPQSMMKQKTRLLVTHGLTYLPKVDCIIVMKDGEVSEIGTYQDLLDKKGAFSEFLTQHLQVKNENPEDLNEIKELLEPNIKDSKSRKSSGGSVSSSDKKYLHCAPHRHYSMDSQHSGSLLHSKNIRNDEDKTGERLIEIEKTETGSVKWEIYVYYFKSVGLFLAILTIVMTAVIQVFDAGSKFWLSAWSNDNATVINGTTVVWKRDMYLGIYCALGLGQGVMVFFMSLSLAKGTIMASIVLFKTTIKRVLKSPISFFDSTPIGRILNRLSSDVDTVDGVIPQNLRGWQMCFFELVTTLVVISVSTPSFVLVILPIGVLYYFVQRFYVATSRQLQRLESVSKSPIYSHFSESVTGAQTIRAYGVQKRFIQESEKRIDFNQMCSYPSSIANRWLSVRLNIVGGLIIFFSALLAVLGRESVSEGVVGLSISYALQITQYMNWLVLLTSNVETNIVSVERIKEYGETPQEAAWGIEETELPKDWPLMGRVEFRDYKVRYREGLDLVLNGLSFVVHGGEKIGIVGRTGAGKSSLTLSLFRIIEAAHGEILIDGIDISTIGLHALRSRLTIIPQDPVLFSGSLRLNLDPFNRQNDEDIWNALAHAHLKSFVESLPLGLLHEVSEGGENLSIGQRQLICLARALLRKTKILILDEATAAVDLDTDDLIQKTIREEFKDCTVLTIAHRLNTIMDADRVIVLSNGNIIEFDTPETLLQKSDSAFYSMVKDAGLTSHK